MTLQREIQDIYLKYINLPDFENSYSTYFNEIQKAGDEVSSDPLPSMFHPVIISQKDLQSLKQQSEQMAVILKKTIQLYLENEEVQKYLDFSEELHEWIMADPGYDVSVPISRYDGFWDGKIIKFCEFNTDGTSGMDEIATLDKAFFDTKIGEQFKEEYSPENFDLKKATLEVLLQSYKSYGGNKKPNIAITDFLESATNSEFRSLKNYFIEQGYNTEICDIKKLKFKGKELWHNDFKIDLIYRRAVTDELWQYRKDVKVFIEACKKRTVCVAGPLRSQIIHSKLIFTFLCDPKSQKYFTEEENKFLQEHIPWTAKLSDDPELINKIVKNKDDFFIKPHNCYGCEGVYCGADTPVEEWKTIINDLLASNPDCYLVQEKIDIPRENYIVDSDGNTNEFNVNIGPYVFNNTLVGFYTRVSINNVITTNRQAQLLPFFVVKE